MNQVRPKNLNLFTIRFPLPAIASILHRISGFLLFFFIPLALWILSFSLTESGFETLREWLKSPLAKVLCWLLLAPFCYHLAAGIRHLLSDMHIGNTLKAGKTAVLGVFVVTGILLLLTGIWLW